MSSFTPSRTPEPPPTAVGAPVQVRFTVYGRPAPQGSKRPVGRDRFGRALMVESSKHVKPWREAVKAAALATLPHVRFDEPLTAHMTFSFDRPKSHWRTGKNAHLLKPTAPLVPVTPPDLSKLIRATEDAITDAGIWRDDSLVASLVVAKAFVGSSNALDRPGAVIAIAPYSPGGGLW